MLELLEDSPFVFSFDKERKSELKPHLMFQDTSNPHDSPSGTNDGVMSVLKRYVKAKQDEKYSKYNRTNVINIDE